MAGSPVGHIATGKPINPNTVDTPTIDPREGRMTRSKQSMNRIQRAVDVVMYHDDYGRGCVSADDALKLLRNEHAWFRRDIQKVRKLITKQDMERDKIYEGMAIAFDHVLTRLTQRRR